MFNNNAPGLTVLNNLDASPVVVIADLLNLPGLDSWRSVLSVEEQQRMAKFRRAIDVQRFLVAHALKRYCLSYCLQVSTHELQFSANASGKPYCTDSNAPYFNISHSGNCVALALSAQSEVGVDIQYYKDCNRTAIVERICSSDEIFRYQQSALPIETFLCLWTQKEAVSKACGKGLSAGLKEINCSGIVGRHALNFLSVRYFLETQIRPDKGVLSFCSSTDKAPVYLQLSHIND